MHLYRHARIHQVFGANTDVGKTILSTALVLASASRQRQVRYLKPVSTGPIQDADDEYANNLPTQYFSPSLIHLFFSQICEAIQLTISQSDTRRLSLPLQRTRQSSSCRATRE